MKKNNAQNTSALRKLVLRRETIQQLTIARLADVEGGARIAAGPTSNQMSCMNTNCTVTINTWLDC
jgi:hypothetical protein